LLRKIQKILGGYFFLPHPVGPWCNAAFGLRVRSTSYLLFAFVRNDVTNDVIVFLHKFKFF